MQSGLRRNRSVSSPAHSSHPSSDSQWQQITTTARQQRPSQPQGTKRKRQRRNEHKENENVNQPALAEDNPDDEVDNPELPNIRNFRQLGQQWGLPRAEEALASLNLPKHNRLSATGLFEAQGLQSAYELDKTMLCIVLKCSRQVLDEYLLEGPLAREPNMYTNYQTYSLVATTTTMPPKGVSTGFKERNAIVGSTWSTYEEEEQEVFTPCLFERLCVATSKAYALTRQPLGITPSLSLEEATTQATTQPPASPLEPLSQDELDKYVPVFQRLVDLQKVSRDLYQGRLWRHSGRAKSQSMEKLMNLEISKIIRQLHVLKNHFNLQFHLLLASWNPTSTAARALFQDEYTSCQRWARDQKKKHLLECFAFESTKAPHSMRPKRHDPKPMSEGAARQGQRRMELAHALNNLIAPYLRGGYCGRGDAHPKVPNLKAGFEAKTFRGNVKLTFNRTPESRITDLMTSKGPGHLTNDEVDIWIDDIKSKYYTIIPVCVGNVQGQGNQDLSTTGNSESKFQLI
ncbi:hypothetical protein DFH28DRAFT_1082086 [Melampsora americana]|nr:hypothetical protein DFH28DRAFT_1082086 [Melampsora americana]